MMNEVPQTHKLYLKKGENEYLNKNEPAHYKSVLISDKQRLRQTRSRDIQEASGKHVLV